MAYVIEHSVPITSCNQLDRLQEERGVEVPALLVGDLSFTEKVPLCAQQGMREFIAWDHCRGIRKGYNKGPFLIPH